MAEKNQLVKCTKHGPNQLGYGICTHVGQRQRPLAHFEVATPQAIGILCCEACSIEHKVEDFLLICEPCAVNMNYVTQERINAERIVN